MNVKTYALNLQVGTVLANGNTVAMVVQQPYASQTMYTESNGAMHNVWQSQPVALIGSTNCLYGGTANGHSRSHCTAKSCY